MLAALAQPRHIKESHRRRRRGASRVWLPGQYYDVESGLMYNGARYYDPTSSRYLQSDPIGLAGGISTFSYVAGNPLSNIDPLGLESPRAASGCGSAGLLLRLPSLFTRRWPETLVQGVVQLVGQTIEAAG